MTGPYKLVLAAAVALLGSGIGAAVAHVRPAGAPAHRRGPVATTATTPPPPPTPAPATSAQLEAGLITPTDMGGYYRVHPGAAEALLDSSACLASLQPSPAQAGRAVTGLLGPDLYSLPAIVEVVDSYRGASPAAVYRSVVAALGSCRTLSFAFGGQRVSAPLAPLALAPVGQADAAWAGRFSYSGATLAVQLGVDLDGQDVVSVVFIDRVPPLDAIMGNFPSTLSLALGKLA